MSQVTPPMSMSSRKSEMNVIISCDWDPGRRYRMVLRGNMAKLNVRTLKGYIEERTGVPVYDQTILYHNNEMIDGQSVKSVGLREGSTIVLKKPLQGQDDFPPPEKPPQNFEHQVQHPQHNISGPPYFSPSESDVNSHQFTQSSYEPPPIRNIHSSEDLRRTRLSHYPAPVEEQHRTPPLPDRVGRIRQVEEQFMDLMTKIPPNPSYTNEYFAGRNDLPSMEERMALEREFILRDRLEQMKEDIAATTEKPSWEERRNRMIGPSRLSLMQKVKSLEATITEAKAQTLVAQSTINDQRGALNKYKQVLNTQRDFLVHQHATIRSSMSPMRAAVVVA